MVDDSIPKTAALVYADLTVGTLVACDYETSLKVPLSVHLEFVSSFSLTVEKHTTPIGVVFYKGDTLVACDTLDKLGLAASMSKSLRKDDTITIRPAHRK